MYLCPAVSFVERLVSHPSTANSPSTPWYCLQRNYSRRPASLAPSSPCKTIYFALYDFLQSNLLQLNTFCFCILSLPCSDVGYPQFSIYKVVFFASETTHKIKDDTNILYEMQKKKNYIKKIPPCNVNRLRWIILNLFCWPINDREKHYAPALLVCDTNLLMVIIFVLHFQLDYMHQNDNHYTLRLKAGTNSCTCRMWLSFCGM